MNYYIFRKREFALIIGVVCIVVVLSLIGAQKIIVDVAAEIKNLPIYSVETEEKEKKLALGINCAWGNEDIPKILTTLEQAEVKATFFVVGDWCERYPESVKQIFDAGHEIGNHSDTHADMTKLNNREMAEEMNRCSDKVEAITGKRPELFRCPSGSYDDKVVKNIVSEGYYPIQWSLDSLDWKGLNTSEMLKRIVPKLTYGDILLFHNDTDYTADTLPILIKEIKQMDYEFVTVGTLIHHGEYTTDVTGRQWKK